MKNHLIGLLGIACLVCLNSCSEEFASANSADGFYYDGEFADQGGDTYNEIIENPFIEVADESTSTFSIDADGGSYANCRRYLMQDATLPPVDAIRTEEFINYFNLDYDYNDYSHPINLNGEVSECPWNANNKLVRIGIKGQPLPEGDLPNSNFVFLIDISGSMSSVDKLDLLKEGFINVLNEMDDQDRIAIVTYAGSAGIVLESTPVSNRGAIESAINSLGSGGSTAGAEGILTAYEIARENFIEGGNNRIIVGTDGDFNVGISSQEDLVTLIEENRDFGVYLTIIGVGRGNLREGQLEQMANNGNGTYEYADSENQLTKIFINEYSKFFAVAKDVKVQVEFNSENIYAYRLIGYENRVLENEDFEDDTKDAGEIGADQSITAIYEVIPTNNIDFRSTESFTIDFRYKLIDSDNSIPLSLDIFDEGNRFDQASDHMQFTAAVASFGLVLRDSEYKGNADFDSILTWLDEANLPDPYGYKSELKDLISSAKSL